jgi:hypothetical protein
MVVGRAREIGADIHQYFEGEQPLEVSEKQSDMRSSRIGLLSRALQQLGHQVRLARRTSPKILPGHFAWQTLGHFEVARESIATKPVFHHRQHLTLLHCETTLSGYTPPPRTGTSASA